MNQEITTAVENVDGVEKCEINLVWEPAWDVSRLSRYAKIALGLHA